MALLEIHHARFKAGNRTILNDLSLSIEAGETHVLIGTNGTGKSTLARLIMGCDGYRLSAGKILFAGEYIGDRRMQDRARLGLSMVWQEPALFEGISVRDYLSLGDKQIDPSSCLNRFGLNPTHYLERPLDQTMSGGERKRIELASMLALQPKLCILDEPVSGIDLLSIRNILSVIGRIKQNGSAILLISHREEVAAIADRASLLCGGHIIASGDPQQIVEQYKSRQCIVCDGQECDYAAG
ncbi:ATP-binding cassette domain-containing protein [Methylomarinum sp. Ch1-1]|uniref:ATP-binding cassette domain-containing protein n=1 Tax=Methylomarinum roseum TaxID=3067653 RepID=A0AAU7NSH4_9GAMM|nr:ATP-binding cassette domain-containing protein [Methylomarinum sp. Ch1-1]MDP4520420.1 ATP-binding cassette domain-containing protein [Methylomarinum sp. Ch1-1]